MWLYFNKLHDLSPTKITSPKSNRLSGTQWRCKGQTKEGIEYHELRFISSTQVEGWSKESGENQAEQMFIATFTIQDNHIIFERKEDSFKAVKAKDALLAFVDGSVMVFHKVP